MIVFFFFLSEVNSVNRTSLLSNVNRKTALFINGRLLCKWTAVFLLSKTDSEKPHNTPTLKMIPILYVQCHYF